VKLLIVAVDEPIYLNPYIGGVIDECGAEIAGVAVYRPVRRKWTAARLRRSLSFALLAALVFSPINLARIISYRLGAWFGWRPSRSLAAICAQRGIPCTTLATVNAPSFAAEIRTLGVDVLLHQTPEILHGEVLRAPRLGVINRHLSLLPAYRGAWPVFWQFMAGEQRLGVTVHLVDEGVDTGAVLAQAVVERQPQDTIARAHERLFSHAVAVTREALARLERGVPQRTASFSAGAYYRTPSPSDVVGFMLGRRRAPVSVKT